MTLPFTVPASLFPADHRWLDFDGARIHYIDEGTGDTLLLLHGNPSWSFLYRKIIARLLDDYRCVAPDYPGRSLTWAFNFVPRYFFRRGLARPVAPEVLRLYLAPWRPRSRRRAAVIAPKQLTAASEFLQEVERAVITKLAKKPVLIVWGTKDFAFGDAERRRFEQIFSTHQTILYDNASHFLQEDAGELIAEEMARFLAELS